MKRKLIAAAAVCSLAGGALLFMLPSCGGDDECLSYGENCTQAYKLSEYGTTSIQCCEGTCSEGSGNGVLVCH